MAVEAGGIGARLRAGREKLGLTVLQVAERIHTDTKIVEAIEVDNYEALGAPVYARGHIRHYAELVGESAAELTAIYSDMSKVGQPDLTRIVKAPTDAGSNKLVAPALLVIAVFAVAGAVWWVSALSKKKPQMSETHVVGEGTPGAQTTATPESETAQTANTAPASASPAPLSVPSATALATASTVRTQPQPQSRPVRPAPSPPPPVPGRNAPASAPVAVAAPAAAVAANTPASAVPAPARGKIQAQVTLRYSADSWTEVYDASGTRLFYDVGAANTVQTVVGTPPLRVVLGNAAGVAVEYNGHNAPIAKLSQPDGSVQFFINRSGRIARSKAVADGG